MTAPAIVVERRGAIEAFGRSYELVRGDGWTVLGVIVVALLILVGLAVAFAFRCGLFNIGGQGQYIAGMIAASQVGDVRTTGLNANSPDSTSRDNTRSPTRTCSMATCPISVQTGVPAARQS